jgi:hypothetical protein
MDTMDGLLGGIGRCREHALRTSSVDTRKDYGDPSEHVSQDVDVQGSSVRCVVQGVLQLQLLH